MTKAKLIEALKAVNEKYADDPEVAHSEADDLLLKYINSPEVKELFDVLPKWYA